MKIITKYLLENDERSFDKKDSVKGIVCRGDYILLLRRQQEQPGGGQWDLPGGGIEKGENKKEALIREVFEECGLKIKDITPQGKVNLKIPESGIDSDMYLFMCYAEDVNVQIKPANWQGASGRAEHTQYKWIQYKDELENLPMLDILKDKVIERLKDRSSK